ncbi:hypothetical protein SEVIR_2G380801v4 [Setaria viridis]
MHSIHTGPQISCDEGIRDRHTHILLIREWMKHAGAAIAHLANSFRILVPTCKCFARQTIRRFKVTIAGLANDIHCKTKAERTLRKSKKGRVMGSRRRHTAAITTSTPPNRKTQDTIAFSNWFI